jgi:hypothetical protein
MVDDIPSEGVIVRIGAASASVPDDAPPARLTLQAAPNPFRSAATVVWYQPAAGAARLGIYDVRGRLVAERRLGGERAGWRRALWDGRSAAGGEAPGGVYWLRLRAGGDVAVAKVVRTR